MFGRKDVQLVVPADGCEYRSRGPDTQPRPSFLPDRPAQMHALYRVPPVAQDRGHRTVLQKESDVRHYLI